MPRGPAAALAGGCCATVGAFNATPARTRRGVGIACMWYGIGNTVARQSRRRCGSGSTPTGRVIALQRRGRHRPGLEHDPVQIAADALGVPAAAIDLVMGDTDRTADAGKTSASRQTFVSGNAAELAGAELRRADPATRQCRRRTRRSSSTTARPDQRRRRRERRSTSPTCRADDDGDVLLGRGPLRSADRAARRATARACPMPTYGFAAQIAEVEVDLELGTVKVLQDRRRARRRPGDQPDPGRRPDPRRHRPGPRPRADGGVRPRPHREPARLPDPDRSATCRRSSAS